MQSFHWGIKFRDTTDVTWSHQAPRERIKSKGRKLATQIGTKKGNSHGGSHQDGEQTIPEFLFQWERSSACSSSTWKGKAFSAQALGKAFLRITDIAFYGEASLPITKSPRPGTTSSLGVRASGMVLSPMPLNTCTQYSKKTLLQTYVRQYSFSAHSL